MAIPRPVQLILTDHGRWAGNPRRFDPTPIPEPVDTGVTDAGLEHLKGLTNLQSLNLEEPRSLTLGWRISKA